MLVGTTIAPVRADEGMWTFDAFPSAKVKAAHGVAPSRAFLDHVRASSARIAGGCSSSFVSPHGLVMTNHHCVVGCVGQLSTEKQDYVETGFYAKRAEDEIKCPGFELDRLDRIEDVTRAVRSATAGKSGRALVDALQAKDAELTAGCGTSEAIRCDVVNLYHGGQYKLYHYRRYTDVRLAFAPEYGVAQFGGDPDNFNFPRFDYDIGLVRAYDKGVAAETPEYLHWSKNGSKAGDVVFVSGNPGSTERLLTVAQLADLRDHVYPKLLPYFSEERGLLEQYQTEGAEQRRQTNETLFGLENSYKAITGQEEALLDPAFFGKKVAQEAALRRGFAKDPALAKRLAADYAAIARAQTISDRLFNRYNYVAIGPRVATFRWARQLVRLPVEKTKASGARLPEYSDAQLVTLPQQLLAPIPTYAGPDELLLGFFAKKMREDLGTDDPFVRKVLGKKSPAAWAHDLVAGTKLGDRAVRKALYDGGRPAVEASSDSMIRFAADVDAEARALRKTYEDEVQAPQTKAAEEIARARFGVTGTTVDPDATFTLRLSYGTVAGFTDANGNAVAPYTTIGGLYDRATGSEPYVLPKSWLAARGTIDPQTPMNVSTTNDIIGGNSGSPLVNVDGEVVGLIFDGNIFSLGGAFGYDPRANRAVAVDSRALLAGLRDVYHADRLVSEIVPSAASK
ncbi:MAG: S46 family peptidase [Vulcanimicrobiaceae bacterium]